MARTRPEAAPAGTASGLVLASCLWHTRTRHRDRPAGRVIAGIAPVPEAGATDKPRCLMWLPPFTVMADEMRPLGKPSSCPQTRHDRREKLALPSRLPINQSSGVCEVHSVLKHTTVGY